MAARFWCTSRLLLAIRRWICPPALVSSTYLIAGCSRFAVLGNPLMLVLEHPQPLGGLLYDPQQDLAGRIRIGWRDRRKIPHAQPDLVLLEVLCRHVAADLLKGVLVTRLDGMAGEEHLGDLGCAQRIDWLLAQ